MVSASPKSLKSCAGTLAPRAASRALRSFFTGPVGVGQIDDCQCVDGQIDGAGWAAPTTLFGWGTWLRKHLSLRAWVFRKSIATSNIRPHRLRRLGNHEKTVGIAICAPIAPYTANPPRCAGDDRGFLAPLLKSTSPTSLEECETPRPQGDCTSWREKARSRNSLGFSDPYEVPTASRASGGTRKSVRCRTIARSKCC